MKLVTTKPERIVVKVDDKELYLHDIISNEFYFARIGLLGDKPETIQEKFEATGRYIASIVSGWNDNEFFGAEFSREHAELLFTNTNNIFLHTLVNEALDERAKKYAEQEKN